MRFQQLREELRAWNDFASGVQARVAAGLPTDVTHELRGKTLLDTVRAHVDAIQAAWEEAELERERLEVTLSSIGDAVIATDTAGAVTYLNPVAVALTGWPVEEARGKPIEKVVNIIHEQTRDTVASPVTLVLREGNIGTLAGQTLLIAKDGREIPIADSAAPIRDNDGKITGVVMVFRDQTAERDAKADLAEKSRLLDLTTDAILIRNVEGVIVYWNRGAEEMYGWSREEAIGKRSHDLLKTEFLKPFEEITEELYRTGHWTGEFVHTTRDGRRITVLARKTLDRDLQGKPAAVLQTLTDITERKRAEEALRESEERFRTMANSMPQLAWTARGDGYIEWYNQRWYEYTGTTPEEMEGWGWQSVQDPEELPKVLERWKASLASGDPFEMTFPLRGADGVFRPFLTRVIPLKNAAGQVMQWFGTNTDVEEMTRAEEAVRVAAERFRFLAESMPQKIFTTEPMGGFNYFNRQWFHYTGLTFEQMRGQGWRCFVHPDDVEETVRRWNHSLETGEYLEMEHRLRRHNGEYRWNVSRAQAMRDSHRETTMWIGSSTDIDDLMRAQKELVHAQEQLADRAVQLEALVEERTSKLRTAHVQLLAEADERKRLEAEIADAVEGERERLGQELHDGLAQELTGIGMLLHVLERQMTKPVPTFASEAGKLCLMVEKAQENTRNLAKSFYPVELEQHGLLVALQNFARRAHERFGILCVVEAEKNAPARLKDATAVQLFRIAQEAVQNAAKHARAREIRVRLGKRDGAWRLTIKDDGVGLPGDAQESSGMGLRIMQYRARIIGGTVEVCNHDGGGVLVTCSVPASNKRRPDGY